MAGKVYTINKGINKALEFKGLKAQYIGYVVGSVLGMMIFFTVVHVSGLSLYLSVPAALGAGAALIARVFRMSKQYGQYGLMKKRARREVPKALRSRSRKCFIKLFSDYANNTR